MTGSRLKGGAQDGPAPVSIFDRAKLEELGITTLPDFLRYVPQQPFVQSEESMTGAGGRYVDLRGLGFGSTAVLIDGRPAAATASSGTFNAFDLNSMPFAAIERIEVLSNSASAVYGANAMGGVINIVLKKEIARPVVDVRYGSAAGGAREHRISITSGYSTERFRGSLLLDYFDRDALFGKERDRWNNQDFRRFGGDDYRSTSANPGTVSSLTADNLPGLSATFAAIPAGSSGVGLTPADFTATAGQRNYASLLRYNSIVGETDRRSGMAFGEFNLTPSLVLFGDFLHEESVNANYFAPSAGTLIVPADNEYNPFDVPVAVSYLFSGVGSRKRFTEAQSDRLLLGLRGDAGDWDWEVWASGTEGDGLQRNSRNTVDFISVNAALQAGAPETFNAFQDGPGGSAALLASFVIPPSVSMKYSSRNRQALAQLRGPLARLPAGTAEVVAGATVSDEDILFDANPFFVSGDRTASAAFAELGIPLATESMNIRALASLRLTAAVRYDHYSDFGDTVNPQYGFVWVPVNGLALRASWGTSFSPPALFNLFAPRQSFPFQVTDPRRNNETAPIDLIAGGNPDLDPTEGESMTAGFVLTPAQVPSLRFSGTYWKVRVNSRVTVISPQVLVDNETLFGERVLRADPTPADVIAGLPGSISSVDISRINFGRLETKGIDWEVSYVRDTRWGRISPSLLATWIDKHSAVKLPGTPADDRIGIASIEGTIPKWKASAALGWARGSVDGSVTARYLHSYDDAIAFVGPTGRRIGSQTLLDMQATVDLGTALARSAWLRDLRLTAGIANVFDKEPAFSQLFGEVGYDSTQGDLTGRFVYLTLSKTL